MKWNESRKMFWFFCSTFYSIVVLFAFHFSHFCLIYFKWSFIGWAWGILFHSFFVLLLLLHDFFILSFIFNINLLPHNCALSYLSCFVFIPPKSPATIWCVMRTKLLFKRQNILLLHCGMIGGWHTTLRQITWIEFSFKYFCLGFLFILFKNYD